MKTPAIVALLSSLFLLAASPAFAGSPSDSDRSPAVAVALATTPLVLGSGLLVAAARVDDERLANTLGWTGVGVLVVGPSAGHVYTGHAKQGMLTMFLRGGGLGAFALGATMSSLGGDVLVGGALMTGGGIAVIGATVYDVFDAAPSAQRHNARVAVTPTVLSSPSGPVSGLALSAQF